MNKSLKRKGGGGVGKVWSDPRGDKVAPDRGEVPGEPSAGCLGSTSRGRNISLSVRNYLRKDNMGICSYLNNETRRSDGAEIFQ